MNGDPDPITETPSSILKSKDENPFADSPSKEVTFDPVTTPTKTTESGKRKSLVGLSPSQDAKVGILKQMFQDHDQEVLCAILFEQCDGNLDATIEAILQMQTALDEPKKEPAGSSLVEEEEEEGEAEQVESKGPATTVDKKTQELIDEMLAEEQQALIQAEEEQEDREKRETAQR